MDKIRIVEVIVLAGIAILSAVKSIIKFIDYISKLHDNSTTAA